MPLNDLPIAERMQKVQAPVIPHVGAWIQQHPGTISLGQGVVNYGPPPQALQALEPYFADPQNHKYQSVDGTTALRTSIEGKLQLENQIEVADGQHVCVTAGANMAFFNALCAIADSGDEIILPAPYYFNHEMAVTMLGCHPVRVPTDANYQPDCAALEAAVTQRTRAIVTVSPNNPTGAVYSRETLTAINSICQENRIYHISDEAYEYFTYGDVHHFSPGSIAGAGRYTISLYSLSKAYGFASWRIGYMVLPENLVDAVKKVQDTVLICPPVVSQCAAQAAIEAGRRYWYPRVQALAQVRDMVLSELVQVSDVCEVPTAEGAFYLLLRIRTDHSAMYLVQRLIADYRVAVIPGTTFGLEQGCYLRVAYGALDRNTVAEGMGRLVAGLKSLVP